jgi:hypothetical protein
VFRPDAGFHAALRAMGDHVRPRISTGQKTLDGLIAAAHVRVVDVSEEPHGQASGWSKLQFEILRARARDLPRRRLLSPSYGDVNRPCVCEMRFTYNCSTVPAALLILLTKDPA